MAIKRGKGLVPVSFWVPKEALEKFRAVAESEGMTLSAKIRNVILKTIRKQN